MPKVRRSSYNLAFKLKVVAEAEAVENNSEIARDYGISESMVRRWRKDQANLFNGELKMSAKRKTMGCFSPKYPELDQTLLDWFSEQRSQGKSFVSLKQWKASKLLCDSSFRRAEPLNSVAAEQFQWSLAAPRRGALQSHSQSPPMAKNFHLPWSSKVFALQETSLFQTLFRVSFDKKGWMDEKGRNLSHFYFIAHW